MVFLSSLRITHPDLADPIRIVNNTEPVQRADGEYVPWSFEAPLPDDNEQPAFGVRRHASPMPVFDTLARLGLKLVTTNASGN